MSERKYRIHSYHELIDLLMELAMDMDRDNDSDMDKYLHKRLRRETSAERSSGWRPHPPNPNQGKGRGGKSKVMQQNPPSNDEGVPNLFYCRPGDDKRGPCHAHDCDGRSSCLPRLQRKSKKNCLSM